MILFINLPIADISTAKTKVMPLSLLALVSYLRKHHVKSELIDLTIKDVNFLISYLRKEEPEFIGISIMVAGQMNNALKLAKYIKHLLPFTTIIFGGTHATQFSDQIYKHYPEIDYIVKGEGEMPTLNILNNSPVKEKQYIDVNDAPLPAYDILDFKDYHSDNSSWHNPYHVDLGIRVPVFTSRGCPNVCNFCSVASTMGYKYRAMSPVKVVDMFQWLNSYGIVYFAVYDANFSQLPKRVIEICNEIKKRNLKIYLDIPAGLPVNVSTDEMVAALVEAGLIRTKVAIESIDDDIRNKVMKKRLKRDDISEAIASIRRYPQIMLTADFIIGMPEDDKKSLDKMCHFIDSLDIDDIGINIATPYPDTVLWDQCVRDKLFNVPAENLWNDPEYTHTNIDRFTIHPYKCDLETLSYYRDRLLQLKISKRIDYEHRMKLFNKPGIYPQFEKK